MSNCRTMRHRPAPSAARKRNLFFTRGRAGEQKIRDIRKQSGAQRADGAEDDPKREPDFAQLIA